MSRTYRKTKDIHPHFFFFYNYMMDNRNISKEKRKTHGDNIKMKKTNCLNIVKKASNKKMRNAVKKDVDQVMKTNDFDEIIEFSIKNIQKKNSLMEIWIY